jgi:aspartate carbamoyltransferase
MALKTFFTREDFQKSSLVSIDQLSLEAVQIIINEAKEIKENPEKFKNLLENKILLSVFLANSTRTRLSTEIAWLKLGGKLASVVGDQDTSIKKGETIDHTLKMYAGYMPDAIAIRTKEEKIPFLAAKTYDNISWVNCGDGNNEHPTQALLDIFTIQEKFKDFKKIKIAFVGDIKHGRTIKSLARLLKLFKIEMLFFAPESLHSQAEFENLEINYQKYDIKDLEKNIKNLDLIYATRPQLERMSKTDKEKYQNGVYQINKQNLADCKCLIMHPLPIDASNLPEIHPELDTDTRSIYFEQAANGLWVRMAIFSLLQGNNKSRSI